MKTVALYWLTLVVTIALISLLLGPGWAGAFIVIFGALAYLRRRIVLAHMTESLEAFRVATMELVDGQQARIVELAAIVNSQKAASAAKVQR